MASRAQVYPDYSYRGGVARQPRPLRFQTNDPVVLPRSRNWDVSGGLMAAAAAATLLVAGATYAVYYTEPARLSETPTTALQREYVPEGDFGRINALKALSGPAPLGSTETVSSDPASPSSAGTLETSSSLMAPSSSVTPSMRSASSNRSEVVIDDSAPGVQESLPQPAENQPSTAPYPNPTTTPPDAIAPSSEPAPGLDGASPTLDTDNPYR